MDTVKYYAKVYWDIRNAGNVGDDRAAAHNDLIDALDAEGVTYADREDAARIGRAIMDGTWQKSTPQRKKLKKTDWWDFVQSALYVCVNGARIDLDSFAPATQRKFSRLFKRGLPPDRAAAIILRYVARLDRAWTLAYPEVCEYQVCARCGKQFGLDEWDARHEPHDPGCPCHVKSWEETDDEPDVEECTCKSRPPTHEECCPECN